MYKITRSLPKAVLLTLMLASSACWADFSVELQNIFNFTKTTSTTENLDRGNFRGTEATTGWRSDKEFSTYVLNGELFWIDTKCTNLYGKVAANYGWVMGGKSINYPLRWDNEGHTKGFDLEAGYIMNVCDRFKFIPQVGFLWNKLDTKIKHQRFSHTSPNCFACQNGNKSSTTLYFPYIGFEFDFDVKFCDCYDVQFSTTYDFGYGEGHSKTTVPCFFVTDEPTTSRYGNCVKYRDMIYHDFEVAATYSLGKGWQIGLEFDYNIIYNTHKLSSKLQRNREIVAAGQFTPSQYHVVSDYFSQTYSIVFNLIYNFSGESGTYIK